MKLEHRNDCINYAYNNIMHCKTDIGWLRSNNTDALCELEDLVLNLIYRHTEFSKVDNTDKVLIYHHALEYIKIQIYALQKLVKSYESRNDKIYFRLQIRLKEFEELKKATLVEIGNLNLEYTIKKI